MADIVLSYARENRQRAESLARALEDAGWSVWWDRAILPGTAYEQVIEAELSAARCVVVLWSAAARQSNWVCDEATVALGRRVLLSVLLDDSEPPLGFRQQQTADLARWTGSAADPEFERLTHGITNVMARGGVAAAPAMSAATGSARSSKRVTAGVVTTLVLACVLVGAGAVIWSTRHRPDRTQSTPAHNALVPQGRDHTAPSQALIVPEHASITLSRENVTLTILAGSLEQLNTTRALKLHIRFSNNGRSFFRTYYTSLRLLVDGVPRAPTDAPTAQVETSSAAEFDYTFDAPATATSVVLRVIGDDQTGDILLNLPATGP
jgi:TIR domain